MLSGKLIKESAMAHMTRVFIAVSIALMMTCTSMLAQTREASESLSVRSDPKKDSRIIAVIRKGTTIDDNDCKDGWCKIMIGKQTGYVLQGLLKECDDCMPAVPTYHPIPKKDSTSKK
jgi:SH3-like domain-containing protein